MSRTSFLKQPHVLLEGMEPPCFMNLFHIDLSKDASLLAQSDRTAAAPDTGELVLELSNMPQDTALMFTSGAT